MSIENTSKTPPELLLAEAWGNPSGFIEDIEARGQRQLVNSTKLPVDTREATDDEFAALGFELGDPDPGDPLFREAKLPDRWKREGSDHAMWSYVVDDRGFRRVAIFYKAAPYDRRAFMELIDVGAECANRSIYDGEDIQWDLLTEDETKSAYEWFEQLATDIEKFPDIYGKHQARLDAVLAGAPK